jgi:hypothetical protein
MLCSDAKTRAQAFGASSLLFRKNGLKNLTGTCTGIVQIPKQIHGGDLAQNAVGLPKALLTAEVD